MAPLLVTPSFCSRPCWRAISLSIAATRFSHAATGDASASLPASAALFRAVMTLVTARCAAPTVSGDSSASRPDRRTRQAARASTKLLSAGRNAASSCANVPCFSAEMPDTRHPSMLISSALDLRITCSPGKKKAGHQHWLAPATATLQKRRRLVASRSRLLRGRAATHLLEVQVGAIQVLVFQLARAVAGLQYTNNNNTSCALKIIPVYVASWSMQGSMLYALAGRILYTLHIQKLCSSASPSQQAFTCVLGQRVQALKSNYRTWRVQSFQSFALSLSVLASRAALS